MSKELPINENFYTYEELRDFTNNFSDRSIINASAFIENKTKGEYSIVRKKMLYELKNALFQNNIVTFNIQRFLNEIWEKYNDNENTKDIAKEVGNFLTKQWTDIVKKNQLVTDRWKAELEDFEVAL